MPTNQQTTILILRVHRVIISAAILLPPARTHVIMIIAASVGGNIITRVETQPVGSVIREMLAGQEGSKGIMLVLRTTIKARVNMPYLLGIGSRETFRGGALSISPSH